MILVKKLKLFKPTTSFLLVIAILSLSLVWQSKAIAQNDLFPNLKEPNNNGPVTIDETGFDDDEDSSIPPLQITPMRPMPGFDFNSSDFGTNQRPNRPNGRPNQPPVSGNTIRTADVPGQYSCPLFENSSYQDLNIAIASLTNAIQGVSDQCKSSQPQVENVRQTSEQIKKAVELLQGYVQNPQAGYENMNQMHASVSTLVTGIDRMSEVFKNVSTLSNSCGRKDMTWGKVALELNNVVNSASPFLLLLTATQPALSLAVKGAIMGTVVGSNVISTMAQVIQSNTVNMEDVDQRNAVLQNTCQYTKVAKKIKYIQMASSPHFQDIEKQIKSKLNNYSMKVMSTSPSLNSMWTVRGNVRNNIGGLQTALRSDKEALEEIYIRIREAQKNSLLICIQGKQIVQMAQDEDSFPNSIQQGILNAYQQNNYLKNIDLTDIQVVYGQHRTTLRDEDEKLKKKVQGLIRTFQSLLNRIANFPDEPNREQAAGCAATTMAFVQHINRMIVETSNIMVEDLDKMEEDLAKNEEYRKWKAEFDKLSNEQENTSRMARVLKELTKPGSGVYNRSEFAEAAENLKQSLLGTRRGLLAGQSPVFAWLNYKRQKFGESKAAFNRTVGIILSRSFGITKSGKGSAGPGINNKQFYADFETAEQMKNLNKSTVPINSPQWELTCIDLEKAIKEYSNALDHLGTTHFMCDMIYDYLDDSVDKKIITYCRGDADYSGKQTLTQKSYIEQATYELTRKPAPKTMSLQQQANLIAKKMIEIGCRLPQASDTL